MGRILATYALVGPVAGALLYVAMSALAGALGVRSPLFMDPALFKAELAQSAGVAGWQIALSAPLSLTPALVTGWLTWRQVRAKGACPWWLSCLYGGAVSGAAGLAGLSAARTAYPGLAVIPPAVEGAALIALVGFLGTWPAWRLLPARYRSSPQKR